MRSTSTNNCCMFSYTCIQVLACSQYSWKCRHVLFCQIQKQSHLQSTCAQVWFDMEGKAKLSAQYKPCTKSIHTFNILSFSDKDSLSVHWRWTLEIPSEIKSWCGLHGDPYKDYKSHNSSKINNVLVMTDMKWR